MQGGGRQHLPPDPDGQHLHSHHHGGREGGGPHTTRECSVTIAYLVPGTIFVCPEATSSEILTSGLPEVYARSLSMA